MWFATDAAAAAKEPEPGLTAADLRIEYRRAPLGIDVARPRFSWILKARSDAPAARGEKQTAYELLVASTRERLDGGQGDLWSSGRVRSPAQLHVVYAGKPLVSAQRVFWKVRVWDRDAVPSAWSEVATFETALVRPADWRGTWIEEDAPAPASHDQRWKLRPAPLFRKEVKLAKPIARARVFVAALGYYELTINGRRVGDQVLDTGWTTYSKRVLYATHDVTEHLRAGRNAVGLLVGNGWWNLLPLKFFERWVLRDELPSGEPRAILHLLVEYQDGTRETFGTDETWKAGPSGLLRNDLYLGEYFDARKHPDRWDMAGFDDRAWKPARRATGSVGPLVAQETPPIRKTRELRPVSVKEPRPGVFVFDFGQNFAGTVTLRARGPAGTRIAMRHAELLYPDGIPNGMTTFAGQIKVGKDQNRMAPRPEDQAHPKTAWQQDVVILRGTGAVETYRPRFTFHGFRYVAVEGYPGRPTLGDLTGNRLNADLERTGTVTTSNDLWNRIAELTVSSLLSNVFSVQSDCPQREKLAYGGDIVATSEMALLQFDMGRFYAKAARDLQDAARPNGGFPETAPYVGIADQGFEGGVGPMGWTVAHPTLLRDLWTYYGDRALLEEQYGALVRHIRFLRPKIPDHITTRDISDHEMVLGRLPRGVTGTAHWYETVRVAGQVAGILGRRADQRRWSALARQIRAAFNARFLDAKTGAYDTGSQTSQAFALWFGLVPEKRWAAAFDLLVRDVVETRGGHLTTGIYGTKYLLDLLPRLGRPEVAAAMVNKRTFPSWGYMIEHGATTLWESWKKDEMWRSHNHPMFGSVNEYLVKHVGGISPAPDAVAFDKIVFRPQPTPEVTWAKASHRSVRGEIVSDWKLAGGVFTWDLVIPVGASGIAYVPGGTPATVTEGGAPVGTAPGVRVVASDSTGLKLGLEPGRYRFEARR